MKVGLIGLGRMGEGMSRKHDETRNRSSRLQELCKS